MTRDEAMALVAEIGKRWHREYRGQLMWADYGTYVVIVTHIPTNTQHRIEDPHWAPVKGRVTA